MKAVKDMLQVIKGSGVTAENRLESCQRYAAND